MDETGQLVLADPEARPAWWSALEQSVARGTLDDAATIAANICGTPSALVSVLDGDRQWFASQLGIESAGTSRDVAFCAYTVEQDDPLVVTDTRDDPRFANNPLVTGEPGIRFYAGTRLTSPGGEPVGALCVIDTAPRDLDQAQRDALVALGRQVSTYWALVNDARTSREGYVSLADAQQMRHDFVDLVSHHLRTPLTSIRTFLELLADGSELDAQLAARLVDVVRNNSDRLLRLVDNLFVMAEASQTSLLLDYGDVDLSALAHRAAGAIQAVAVRKGLRVAVHTTGPVHVTGDAKRLAHALDHLAFNAVRFTERGGRIELRVRRDPLPVVEVSDTGVGIEPDRQPQLVDPLACLGSDTGEAADHCVGLAAVNAVVYAHHGTLDVDSRPGRGTTFRMTLPVTTGTETPRLPVDRARLGLRGGGH